VHAPASGDCQTCHLPHASAERALIVLPITETCGQCHDFKKGSFSKAHLAISASVMDCRECHDPHASKDPKFFKTMTHPPFAGGSCGDCHITGKE